MGHGESKRIDARVPQSGFRDITWNRRRGKWRVIICHEGQRHTLGHFNTVKQARRVLETFRKRHGRMVGLDAVQGGDIVLQFKISQGLIDPRRAEERRLRTYIETRLIELLDDEDDR